MLEALNLKNNTETRYRCQVSIYRTIGPLVFLHRRVPCRPALSFSDHHLRCGGWLNLEFSIREKHSGWAIKRFKFLKPNQTTVTQSPKALFPRCICDEGCLRWSKARTHLGIRRYAFETIASGWPVATDLSENISALVGFKPVQNWYVAQKEVYFPITLPTELTWMPIINSGHIRVSGKE